MNVHHEDPATGLANAGQDSDHEAIQTDELLHVVSVGTLEHGYLLHDLLLNNRAWRLSVITDCLQLWEMPEREAVHLAILHDTLSLPDLDEAAHAVRRRWPKAKILVLRSGGEFLEDALYDDRALPSTSAPALLASIESILGRAHAEGRAPRS